MEASPAAPAIGNNDPAATTPAATQVATSFPSELIADTGPEYVNTPVPPPREASAAHDSLLLLCDYGNNMRERGTFRTRMMSWSDGTHGREAPVDTVGPPRRVGPEGRRRVRQPVRDSTQTGVHR
ncbi:hypothetical protein GCM10009831_23880 [Dietzia cercidiphylli]|uniref:Uncharacterized protein n=1 Tax=Dietzia cercidiphylli TaxID=498199 RepID=A0ABN2IWZ9_9ACTN